MSVIDPTNVPQANSLNKVCDLLALVEAGMGTPKILEAQLSLVLRELDYYKHAARILGLANFAEGDFSICERGKRLLQAKTPEEKNAVLREGILSAEVFSETSAFFGKRTPTKEELTAFLLEHTDLGRSTAARRAHTMLAWLKAIDREQ
jgi:hypothetical protein